jgi:hypothetical protein
MAKAVVAALHDAGFHAGTVVARDARTGAALADRCGFTWRAEVGCSRPQLLVNATRWGCRVGRRRRLAGGARGGGRRRDDHGRGRLPALTPLVRRARAQGKQVITGTEVIALQAVEQFVLYTGVRPTDDQVRRASEFSPRIAQHRELPCGPLARCRTRLASPSGHGPHPDRARQALPAGSTVEPRCGSVLAVPAGLVGWSEPGNQAKGGEAS